MNAPSVQVDNHDAFGTEIKSGAAFRGQTHDYGSLIPSLFRQELEINTKRLNSLASNAWNEVLNVIRQELNEADETVYRRQMSCYRREMGWFMKFLYAVGIKLGVVDRDYYESLLEVEPIIPGARAFGGFGYPSQYDKDFWLGWTFPYGSPIGLLQHYGVPTGALDITFDPAVALWFATHRYVPTGRREGYYTRSDTEGVVHVLQAPANQIFDLREGRRLGVAGLRAIRQQSGLLLGATTSSPDLVHFVVKKIYVVAHSINRVETELNTEKTRCLTQEYLFPSAHEDLLYGTLLKHRSSGNEELRELLNWVVEYISEPQASNKARSIIRCNTLRGWLEKFRLLLYACVSTGV